MLSPVKSQRINLTLNGQECTLRLTQHESALYLDLTVKGIPVVQGVPVCMARALYAMPGSASPVIYSSWIPKGKKTRVGTV